MNRPGILAALAICLMAPPYPSAAQDAGDHDIVALEKTPENLRLLHALQLDLLMERGGRVYFVVGVRDLLRLDRSLVPFTIETFHFPPYTDSPVFPEEDGPGRRSPLLHSGSDADGPASRRSSAQDGASPPLAAQYGVNGEFHSYGETERALMMLEQTYPTLAKLISIGESLEGRRLWALKLSDNVFQDEDEAEVLFLGCHHAREWISVDVPLRMARHLAEGYGSDERIRSLLDRSEVWILPIVNPDGLEYSIQVYRYWRKNRRDHGDGSFGVDLNRNYGYKWGYDDIGSSGDPASAIYRGSGPFSEPESRAIRDFVGGRDFKALISYHNYSQIILYPWGYVREPAPEDVLLEELAAAMSGLMARVHGRVYDFGPAGSSLYTTNGDTADWALGERGIPAFTIELPPVSQETGGFFNAEQDIIPIFEENLAAALFLIEWAIGIHDGERANPAARVGRSDRSRQERDKGGGRIQRSGG